MIDSKSPYTARHSTRVGEIAGSLAVELGLGIADRERPYRDALERTIDATG